MEAYQKRIILERNALDMKISRLEVFFETKTFEGLSEDEQECLDGQAHAMKLYSYFLTKRLCAFQKSPDAFVTKV